MGQKHHHGVNLILWNSHWWKEVEARQEMQTSGDSTWDTCKNN